MINFKKLKALSISSAAAFVGALALTVATSFGAHVTLNEVNYDEATVKGTTGGQSFIKYSLDGGATWIKYKTESNGAFTIDISSLSPSKKAVILTKNTTVGETNEAGFTINPEVAWSPKDVPVYNTTSSTVTFGTSKAVDVRTAPTAVWNRLSNGSTGYNVAKLEPKGGSVYVRIAGTTFSSISSSTSTAITRPSKVKTIKVAAQAKAPAPKIDYVKGQVTGLKATIEFTLYDATNNKYFASTTASSATLTTEKWLTTTASALDLSPFVASNKLTIEVRTAATAVKKESLSTEFIVSQSAIAPSPDLVTGATFSYNDENITVSKVKAFEYAIVSGTGIAPDASTKWTALTTTNTALTSKITALKSNSTLWIRTAGNKVTMNVPSAGRAYKFNPRPLVSSASINFAAETLSFNDASTVTIQYTTATAATKFTSPAANTLLTTQANVSCSLKAFTNIDNSKATLNYRKAPVITNTYDGIFASLPKTIAIAKRDAAPKATYKFADETFSIPANLQWSTQSAATITQWLTTTSAVSTVYQVDTSTKTALTVRKPATATKVASLPFTVVSTTVAAAKIVSTDLVLSIDPATAKNTSGTAAIVTTELTNAVTCGAINKGQITATYKYASGTKANVKTGDTFLATVVLTAKDGFRFNATTNDAAKALITYAGGHTTEGNATLAATGSGSTLRNCTKITLKVKVKVQ